MMVELVSPERVLFSGDASMVIVRTVGGGDVAFLPGHAPFLGALQDWPASIHLADGSVKRVAVHGGFVEVSNDTVAILADMAELAEDIDVSRAEAALQRAQERRGGQEEVEEAEAQADLLRAQSRLNAARGTAERVH